MRKFSSLKKCISKLSIENQNQNLLDLKYLCKSWPKTLDK